jgi:hypothetical protein
MRLPSRDAVFNSTFSTFSACASLVLATIITTSSLWQPAISTSIAPNPLHALAVVQNPSILTRNHRVSPLSNFDLAFDLHDRRILLRLQPNDDIIPDGAVVTHLDPQGRIVKTESIDRMAHKVYKGRTWIKNTNSLYGAKGTWRNVGFARIVVSRDGTEPLFEGAFAIGQDNHHLQIAKNYMATRHELDPILEEAGADEYMVCFRDSDVAVDLPKDAAGRVELKKRKLVGECGSDNLEFNRLPDHPVYAGMLKRDQQTRKDEFTMARSDGFWSSPFANLMAKRQNDISPGGGNSAGVNLTSTIGSTAGCSTTRKVALVGVATDCTYTGSFNSTESARQNVITQMNTASDLYEKTFNITLGLQNLTVSDPQCPGTPPASQPWNEPCSANQDIQARLNTFSGWRGQQQDSNSHWTLLTTCQSGSAVGLAWLGQACVQGSQNSNGTGQGQETVAGANVVVRTKTEWQVIA